MKPKLTSARLVVKKSLISGYGVFANQAIAAGEIIEEAYAVSLPNSPPELANFVFSRRDGSPDILSFGYGSLYNHADDPNACYVLDSENNTLIFSATHDIRCGEEIFISYGKDWFSYRQLKQKKIPLFYRWRRFFSQLFRLAVVLSFIALVTTLIEKLPVLPS